jgi:hypothetical protein
MSEHRYMIFQETPDAPVTGETVVSGLRGMDGVEILDFGPGHVFVSVADGYPEWTSELPAFAGWAISQERRYRVPTVMMLPERKPSNDGRRRRATPRAG